MSAKPQSRRNGEQPVSLLDTLKEAAESQKNLVELPLRSILLDQTFQVRVGGLDADHLANLRALVDSGGQFKDPIIVYDTPVGRFLTDGWHRYTIAMEFNWVAIPAELRSGTYEQALDAAEEANLHHGKMLSNEDKKNLLIRRLGRGHAWGELSSREIGRQLGVGKDTVRRWIDDYNATGAFAPVERTTTKGADGKTRNTAGISSANQQREKPAPLKSDTLPDALHEPPFLNIPRQAPDREGATLNALAKELANAEAALRLMDTGRYNLFQLIEAFKTKWQAEQVKFLLERVYDFGADLRNEAYEIAKELGLTE